MERYTLRFFGIKIMSWERLQIDLTDNSILSNVGGQFEIAPDVVEEEEEDWEEEYRFGFRRPL